MVSFTDSDWAGDLDTRKSTSGFVFLLHGGAVSWKSTKQGIVATSSTEAEYVACSEAVKEALWIQRLFRELQTAKAVQIQSGPQVIFVDNQGAIELSKNPQHHNRTKHIDVKYYFIHNYV